MLTRSGTPASTRSRSADASAIRRSNPGRYLARLAATDDAGAWRAETLRFTIVKH